MDFAADNEGSEAYADIPTRPMRVKVLYSFDLENKTNCLARFPNTLQIPAVAIDDNSQVGVIELKQCIQAVTAASPELLSRLSDGDFTIYAFDYSEYETPLVGQGMLSAVLAAPSPGPGVEKTMITGRVCKNIPAIFSNGIKETLEVKLRLVSVPKAAQGVAPRPEIYRGASPATSGGFDPNAWNASMNQQRPQHGNEMFNFDSSGDVLMDQLFGVESGVSGTTSGAQGMAGVVGTAQTPTDSSAFFNPAFATNSHSAPGSRSGSPIIGPNPGPRNSQLRHQSFSGHSQNFADPSRPDSRARVQSEVLSPRSYQASTASVPNPPQNEGFYNEDGQPRKRAKVTQADWRGKASFGSKSADLRVTAATAASMHMHRPIAKKPSAPGSDLEPPPRVPTPLPQRTVLLPHQRPLQPAPPRSMLRQASTAESDIMSDYDNRSEAVMSSPEEHSPSNSMTGTPQEIPSSPPVYTGFNLPLQSSPSMPGRSSSRFNDSGYMSERMYPGSNAREEYEMDERNYNLGIMGRQPYPSQPFVKIEGDGSEPSFLYPRDGTPGDIDVHLEMPGDMNQLPQKMRLDVPIYRQRQASQGVKLPGPFGPRKASRGPSTPLDDQPTPSTETAPASRRPSLALPTNSLIRQDSLPAKKIPLKRKPFKRSATFNDSEAGSPAPSDNEGGGRPRGTRRSGSGAPRSVRIKEKLEQAISNGETPQYCSHCGAIETPTWRKLYVKYIDGKPCNLDSCEGEGETVGLENLEFDEQGQVTRFVIRKSMKRTKDFQPGVGFEGVVVCNPCGLWFNKMRYMRPSDRWHKKAPTRRGKKRAESDGVPPSTDGLEPQSEAFFADQVGGGETPEGETQDESGDGNAQKPAITRRAAGRARSMEPEQTRRGSDDGWNASQLGEALARQVQSSPVRFGSQHSPIEIDDQTPRPTRRLLFPSPRKEGEVKSLDDNGQVSLGVGLSTQKKKRQSDMPKVDFAPMNNDVNIFEAFTREKENLPLTAEDDADEFGDLFNGSPVQFKTPTKKTPAKSTITPRSQRQLRHLVQTPTPASRKGKPLSPNPNAANLANDFMTSPTNSRYFLRSTPSRQERTPSNRGGLSGEQGQTEASPFSRHLAQMLSDANDSGVYTSPSRAFDFSDLPTFTTPGRNMDWSSIDDILSSEFAAFDGSGGPQQGSDSVN